MSRIKIDATTYQEDATVDSALFETVIGDDKQPEFYPQVKVQRWTNEANFSARLVPLDASSATVIEEADKLRYASAEYEARFFSRSAWSNSAYEFDVVLNSRPKSNVLQWTVQSKNLIATYQGPLTAQEISDGAERPDHVIGSYALYHASKKYNAYKAGKAFHIFRPYVSDALGDWTWGELALDLVAGTMSVTVENNWLNRATYPVTVDPTFGFTTAGASWQSMSADYALFQFGAPADGDGTVDKVTVHIKNSWNDTDTDYKGALWLKSSGALQEASSAVTHDQYLAGAWVDFTLSGTPSVTDATDYIIGSIADPADPDPNIAFDSAGAENGGWKVNVGYASPGSISSPYGGPDRDYSAYATYTVSGTTIAIGLATETDSAFAHTVELGFDVGLSTETDSAFAVTLDKARDIGLSTVSEQAFATTVGHGRNIGLATSTESAFAVTKALQYPIGLATETDSAFAVSIGSVLPIGLSTESDAAFALSKGLGYSVGLATSTESAFAVTKALQYALGLASETDSAFAVTKGIGASIGLATSTESAFAMGLAKGYAIGLATETDSAFAMTVSGAVVIGLATEADSAFDVSKGLGYGIGLATESDTAFDMSTGLVIPIGLSTEADSALAASYAKGYSIGLALETDTAFPLILPQTVAIGLALETDTAFSFTLDTGAPTVVGVGYTLRDGLGHFALLDGRIHYTLRSDDST